MPRRFIGTIENCSRSAALQEEDAIVVGNGEKRPQICFTFSMIWRNVPLRWLISRIDAPAPGKAIRSRWASASTGIGNVAGPAEKL